jgi:hypothetical protein
MPRFAIIDAPSILGLRPTGVEQLPEALKAAGLHTSLQADDRWACSAAVLRPATRPENAAAES